MTDEYLQDLMVRMAHHSTAIEGNSLTQGETKSVLIDEYIPRPMDLRELNEVLNYKALLPYLLEHQKEEITLSGIKDINEIIMTSIDSRGGQFKVIANAIIGADFTPTPPYMVPEELKKWVDDLSWRLENSADEDGKIFSIMDQHLRFEHIHPFADGNGRTGRALIIWSCLHESLTPIIIEKEQRKAYINALNRSDAKGLFSLAKEIQEKEKERMALFS